MAERAEQHVARFNAAVVSGDWTSFADDATLEYAGGPAGRWRGRDAIAAAYREQRPHDTLTATAVRTTASRDEIDVVSSRGAAAVLSVDWTPDGRIERMVMEFA